jgi:hypothetical protein
MARSTDQLRKGTMPGGSPDKETRIAVRVSAPLGIYVARVNVEAVTCGDWISKSNKMIAAWCPETQH